MSDTNSLSNVKLSIEANPFPGADIEDELGTLPMSRSVPAAKPRSGQFSCPKPGGKFEN